jgi:serine protease AprX
MGDRSWPPFGDDAADAFRPEHLDRMVITPPLLYALQDAANDATEFDVIIDLNLDYPEGRESARRRVLALIGEADGGAPQSDVRSGGTDPTQPYLFATLTGATIRYVVGHDRTETLGRGAIYRVWEDSIVYPLITKSIATVKADAAQISYGAVGTGIVWAVMDSGIESGHIHFEEFQNLDPPKPVAHHDFTGSPNGALSDPFGHGTHVAGIIGGQFKCRDGDAPRKALAVMRDENGKTVTQTSDIRTISGMAPRCKLVSYKILDDAGRGRVSSIIDAIAAVQRLNDYGRRLLVHGVNLSVGYDFDPKWFACGQSPLCVEIDRLVRSGVVVVAAAGNTGYGWTQTQQRGNVAAGLTMSINDPGNSELAITVGSTHRDMPHTYGVSYFSSKGPTGDGRAKPDLVAPGERIISCAAGAKRLSDSTTEPVDYVEDSGTSMAAPHVSGIVASFLSIRREYIGAPDDVKAVLLSTATDLKRERAFQGAGLVDLMRAIGAV